ncbi:MAG TPA: AMP-binding protein [Syntrophomonas sp.]|nr:AMP-binding protein [Syntrophomonas sp.]
MKEESGEISSLDRFEAATPTIPQMFYHTVQNAGNEPANIFKAGKEWKTVSYKEWAVISEEIAGALIRYGVKKGDDIALMARPCVQRGWTGLAILLTGAVTAIITPMVSDEELKFILNRSDIKYLFAENTAILERVASLWGQLPYLKGIICLEGDYTSCQKNIWGLEEFRAAGREYSLPPSQLSCFWKRLVSTDPAVYEYSKSTAGRLKSSPVSHGEWIETEWKRPGGSKTNYVQNNSNICATIMTIPSVKERIAGYFSMVANGVPIKYGVGPSRIKCLQELNTIRH